ncbi:MAG: BspA family leucine-rich repeat surface protein [Lachnospiraceae bacterium]|nr:BspA family leucine-rich repeat surface protein [Lachnospiraceae bacterium]
MSSELKKIDYSGIKDFNDVTNIYDWMTYLNYQVEIIWPKNMTMPNLQNAINVFAYSPELKEMDISELDVSNATVFNGFISDCPKLEKFSFGKHQFKNAVSFSDFFGSDYSLKEVDMNEIDTSNVVDLSYMFEDCRSIEYLDFSDFDTGNVADMHYMFSGCSGLEELDLSNFDTANVSYNSYGSNGFSAMFFGCSSLSELDISNFDCSIPFPFSAFTGCSSLETLHLPANMEFESDDCYYLYNSETEDYEEHYIDELANLKTIYYSGSKANFENLPKSERAAALLDDFIIVDLEEDITPDEPADAKVVYCMNDVETSYFHESTVSDSERIAAAKKYADDMLSKGKKSGLSDTGIYMESFMSGVSWDLYNNGLIYIHGTAVIDKNASSYNADVLGKSLNEYVKGILYEVNGGYSIYGIKDFPNLEEIVISPYMDGSEICTLWDSNSCGSDFEKLKSIHISCNTGDSFWNLGRMPSGDSVEEVIFDGELANSITGFESYFCPKCKKLDLSGFTTLDSVSSITGFCANRNDPMEIIWPKDVSLPNLVNANGVFSRNSSFSELDISCIDLSNCEYMSYFAGENDNLKSFSFGKQSFKKPAQLSSFLCDNPALKEVDMHELDTSNVYSLSGMFQECRSLESLDFSNFDTSNVALMCYMFEGCSSLKELDLSDFDTGSVNNYSRMFAGCSSLKELDISNFDSSAPFPFSAFTGCSSLETLYLPQNTEFESDECFGRFDTEGNYEEHYIDELSNLQTIYYYGSKEDFEKLTKSDRIAELFDDFSVVSAAKSSKMPKHSGKVIYCLGNVSSKKEPAHVYIKKNNQLSDITIDSSKEYKDADSYKLYTASKESFYIVVEPDPSWGAVESYELFLQTKGTVRKSENRYFTFSNAGDLRDFVNLYGNEWNDNTKFAVRVVLKDKSKPAPAPILTRLCVSDVFKVVYKYLDGVTNDSVEWVKFSNKESFLSPSEPVRADYVFKGWYENNFYNNYEFFSKDNVERRKKIDGDIILWANWKATSLKFSEDTWGFSNSSAYFCPTRTDATKEVKDSSGHNVYHYEIYDTDYSKLVGQYKKDEAFFREKRFKQWSGSCYGMSVTTVLNYYGDIDISQYSPGFTNMRKVTSLDDSTSVVTSVKTPDGPIYTLSTSKTESFINYYLLSEYAKPYFNKWKDNLVTKDKNGNVICDAQKISERIEQIISYFPLEDVAVLDIEFSTQSAHAVCIYDVTKEGPDRYHGYIYDCSYPNKPYDIVFYKDSSDGLYKMQADEWNAKWNESSNHGDIIPEAIITRDEIVNGVADLNGGTPGNHNVSSVMSVDGNDNDEEVYELTTSYGNFTISDGTNTAKVENGWFVSNDLGATAYGNKADVVSEIPEYVFALPVLADGKEYTITQDSNEEYESNTTLYYDDENDGFFVWVSSEEDGTVKIDSKGKVVTKFDASTGQYISVAYNSLDAEWSATEIFGTDTGMSIGQSGDTVSVDTDTDNAKLNVTVAGMINELLLEDVTVPADGIVISEDDSSKCIISDTNGTEITSGYFGYCVIFDSNGGYEVPTVKNVVSGSTIDKPADPVRPGYIFKGWYKDNELKSLWDFGNDTVTADTTLYAAWEYDASAYKTVTFQMPSGNTQRLTLLSGSKLTEDMCPTVDGTEDVEWYKDEYGINEWDFENDTLTKDITLYAFTPECTVSFVTGCDTVIDPVVAQIGSLIAKPGALSVNGQTFCGWYADESYATEWDFSEDAVEGDMTLYAKWSGNIIDTKENDTLISIELLNPNGYSYTGAQIKPAIRVYDDNKVLAEGTDYKVTYKNNVNACDIATTTLADSKKPQVIVQGIGAYKSAKKLTEFFSIKVIDMKDLSYDVPSVAAAKSGSKPQSVKATVRNGNSTISSKLYTIKYYTDAELKTEVKGLTKEGTYFVVFESKNSNISGVSDVFEVNVVSSSLAVSKMKVTLNKNIKCEEKALGRDETIAKIVKKAALGKDTYISNADYETFFNIFKVSIKDENGSTYTGGGIGKALLTAGKKTMTITAFDENAKNYTGSISVNFTVSGKKLNSKDFKVTYDETAAKAITSSAYTGKSNLPKIVSDLKVNTDYKVTYLKGKESLYGYEIKDAGTYTAVITGINKYQGTVKCKFTIKPLNVANAYADGNTVIAVSDVPLSPAGSKPEISVSLTSGEDTFNLIEGTDFKAAFSNNKKASPDGKFASVKLTGIGNFAGTIKGDGVTEKDSTKALKKGIAKELNFKVTPKDISSNDVSLTVSKINYAKSGAFKGVSLSLTDNGVKISAKDYTTTATEAEGLITLTITGKGTNYTGSRVETIPNTLISVSDAKKVKIARVSSDKIYYTGEAINPAVTITDAAGNDISDKVIVTYGENTKVGTGKITVTGDVSKGYIGKKTVTFVILPKWAQWLFK